MVKTIIRVFTDPKTSKAFGIEGSMTISQLHEEMAKKMELPPGEFKKWRVTEKRVDTERFPEDDEDVLKLIANWDKEKKKSKTPTKEEDYQFWWKPRTLENRTIRVYFRDGTYKAVVINADTVAAQLHEAVVQKIELHMDQNFGLFDVRKKGDRPLPSSENIFNIMEDWKKTSKKPEEECRFVFKLKSSMNEDVVEDPVRVHLLYLESKNDITVGVLNPGEEETLQLAALEVQINFGDHNPSVHVVGFLGGKLKELIPNKKLLNARKESVWEKDIFKLHAQQKGMRPLFAKLEYLQILHPTFRASASIVAINKAEQAKRDEEAAMKKAKPAPSPVPAATAKPAATPVASTSTTTPTPSAGIPIPPPPPAPTPAATTEEDDDINAFPTLAELTATTVSKRVSSRFDMLASIEQGVKLKGLDDGVVKDRSAPRLESSVKIKKIDRKAMLDGIGSGGSQLKHTETVDKSAAKVAGVKIKKIDRKGLLDGIEGGDAKLKKTETVDKSGPKITVKKVDATGVVGEISKGEMKLKKAETVDKSGPMVDKNIKVKKIDRQGLLSDIQGEAKLKRTETVDKSAPAISSTLKVQTGLRQNLLSSIEDGVLLNHVVPGQNTPRPRFSNIGGAPGTYGLNSKPVPKGATVAPPKLLSRPAGTGYKKPAPQYRGVAGAIPPPPPMPSGDTVSTKFDVVKSIEKGTSNLRKVETIDKSGPKITEVKIKKVDRKAILDGIEKGDSDLKKVETVDKSAPKFEGVKVKKIDRKGMLDGIEKGEKKLKKAETVDKSAPKITVKKVDPNAVLGDIAKGEAHLKKVKTVDKSSPVVERIKVKKIDRVSLLRGIEAGVDLEHVEEEEQKDASGPLLEKTVKVKKGDGRVNLLSDIQKGAQLKKVEDDAAEQ